MHDVLIYLNNIYPTQATNTSDRKICTYKYRSQQIIERVPPSQGMLHFANNTKVLLLKDKCGYRLSSYNIRACIHV